MRENLPRTRLALFKTLDFSLKIALAWPLLKYVTNRIDSVKKCPKNSRPVRQIKNKPAKL
jgi:hypothetical protein